MSIKKLTKRLQGSIDFALDNEEDLNSASWNYQEGILITVNEAKLLLDIVKNCSIPDVVGQSEQFYCDQEKTIKRCKNQCMRCNKFWKPKKQ
jgi:hypothetical protein